MAEIICHHNGRYNIYHTGSDRFKFSESLDLEQLWDEIRESQGSIGLKNLPGRLDRANKTGVSVMSEYPETLDSFLICNRAGDNEATLTTQECIDKYLS